MNGDYDLSKLQTVPALDVHQHNPFSGHCLLIGQQIMLRSCALMHGHAAGAYQGFEQQSLGNAWRMLLLLLIEEVQNSSYTHRVGTHVKAVFAGRLIDRTRLQLGGLPAGLVCEPEAVHPCTVVCYDIECGPL